MDVPSNPINLHRYGNIFILGAPSWSEVSVQLVHGWPRKLSKHVSHGGVTKGNIIAASRASNACILRFGLRFDVASLVAKHVIQSVGLSLAQLLTCR